MKRILGMVLSIGAMAVLLGALTGCPDNTKKVTDKKTTEEVKTDKEKTKTEKEKTTTETEKKP